MSAWQPDQYHKFQKERAQPFDDLLRLALPLQRPGARIIDLGCGTGELTAKLMSLSPTATVLGADSSETMLQKAQAYACDRLSFRQETIEDFVEKDLDVLFSNAAVQWCSNHESLLPRLLACVKPHGSGQLLIQMPSNHNHVSHRLLREIVQEEPFRTELGGFVRLSPVLSVDEYANILFACGADPETMEVFEKVYPHVLQDSDAVVEWIKGTAIVPYRERLSAASYDLFLQRYRERMRQHLPTSPVFYGFRRILIRCLRK